MTDQHSAQTPGSDVPGSPANFDASTHPANANANANANASFGNAPQYQTGYSSPYPSYGVPQPGGPTAPRSDGSAAQYPFGNRGQASASFGASQPAASAQTSFDAPTANQQTTQPYPRTEAAFGAASQPPTAATQPTVPLTPPSYSSSYGTPTTASFTTPVNPQPQPQPQQLRPRKRGLGAGAVIGIAAATALIVGAGSAYGTAMLLPPTARGTVTSSSTVVQAASNSTNWTSVAEQVRNSVVAVQVQVRGGQSQGSGVVWDGDGHVITNNHVVEGAATEDAVIVTIGNRGYQASILGTDPATDLAVLKVENPPKTLVPLTRGDSSTLKVGDPVMAIGNPLGLSGSYTTGIVSALSRPVTTGQVSGNAVVTNAIQTSAALNPGNSGGALVNAAGQLVGINSSIATLGQGNPQDQAGSIGIGFAIPDKLVELVAKQLIETGKVQHAWFGSSNTDGQAQFEGSIILGAQVRDVAPDGPAAKAGIQQGDLIIKVDDQEISDSSSLVGVVRTYQAGATAKVTFIRNGQQQEASLTFGVSPTLNG